MPMSSEPMPPFDDRQTNGSQPERPEKGAGLPWLLTGAALLAGVALARAIDWRGHAHPRL